MNSHQRRKLRRVKLVIMVAPSCGYWHEGGIECRGDGYMWDADNDGYDPDDHSMPCPCCNTLAWLEQAKEEAECVSSFSGSGGSGTGEDIWVNSVKAAMRVNAQAAQASLLKIGVVKALSYDDEKIFVYE